MRSPHWTRERLTYGAPHPMWSRWHRCERCDQEGAMPVRLFITGCLSTQLCDGCFDELRTRLDRARGRSVWYGDWPTLDALLGSE
jgi:hypothetical protein